jgi:hypothetical protein
MAFGFSMFRSQTSRFSVLQPGSTVKLNARKIAQGSVLDKGSAELFNNGAVCVQANAPGA